MASDPMHGLRGLMREQSGIAERPKRRCPACGYLHREGRDRTLRAHTLCGGYGTEMCSGEDVREGAGGDGE